MTLFNILFCQPSLSNEVTNSFPIFLSLSQVDRELQRPLRFMDTICDLLYHVKYQFTGDSIRQDVERIEKELSPPLQLRLRFIAPKL